MEERGEAEDKIEVKKITFGAVLGICQTCNVHLTRYLYIE